jgi:hypothetical protein
MTVFILRHDIDGVGSVKLIQLRPPVGLKLPAQPLYKYLMAIVSDFRVQTARKGFLGT